MKIDVYETKKKSTFVFVEQGKKIEELPEEIRQLIRNSKPWKTIETNQKPLNALDLKSQVEVEAKIKEQGYCLRRGQVIVKEKIGKM